MRRDSHASSTTSSASTTSEQSSHNHEPRRTETSDCPGLVRLTSAVAPLDNGAVLELLQSLGRSATNVTENAFGSRPACFKSTTQECLYVLVATMCMAMSSFLGGSCVIVTAAIAADLGMTTSETTWITASSSLTAGSFLLCFGQSADLLGRKKMLVAGLASFCVFGLITAWATNPFYMDILCGMMGLASAAVVPPAVGILGAAYDQPSRRKNLAFALFSAGNPLGFVVGSIGSGIATHLFNWRASFIFLVIVFAIVTVLAYFATPSQPAAVTGGWKAALKEFDYLGILLAVTGLALFSSALTLAPTAPKTWSTPYILVLLILGVVLIAAFIVWEKYCKNPLMPLWIWKDRNFSLLNLLVMFGFMSFNSSQFWLCLYMQDVQKLSSLIIAVRLMPQAIAGSLYNVVMGNILHRVNNTFIMGFGAVSYVIGALLLYLMKNNSNYWLYMFLSLIITVLGADLEFNVANMYVMQSLPSHQQSLAGGVFNTVTKLCVPVGLGITTSIFTTYTDTGSNDPKYPYSQAFLACVGMAAAACLFVPFLTVKTQGNRVVEPPVENARETTAVESKTLGEDSNHASPANPTIIDEEKAL